jgi:hypothetical protein
LKESSNEDSNQMPINESPTSSRTRLTTPTSRSNVSLNFNVLTSNNEYKKDVGKDLEGHQNRLVESALFERPKKITEDLEAAMNSSVSNSEFNFENSKNAPNSPTFVKKTPPRTDRSL